LISCSKEDDINSNIQKDQTISTITHVDKNVDELLTFYYEEYQSNSKSIFGAIWKWMKAHVGTHLFENCQGNMPCGSCAGICFNASNKSDIFTPVDETYVISNDDYNDGERLCQIALFNDTIMGFSFIHSGYVYNDSLYIPENLNIGNSASALFEKDSIIVLQGVYPVSFTQGRNGSTVVDIRSY